jgi:hypothetical protein
MQAALDKLFRNVNLYYADPDRYPLRVKAAWDWRFPIRSASPGEAAASLDSLEWERVSVRSRALTEAAPHGTLLIQTILKLALDDNYYVAYSAPVNDLYAWGQDSYHFEELAHAAHIVLLQRTKWESTAEQVAFLAEQLANYKPDSVNVPHVLPMQTATAILAIGRWATDKSLNPWDRYAAFVSPICKMVNAPPFLAGQISDPADPRLGSALSTFEKWFEKKKPSLQAQADAERPRLQSLAKELSANIE